MDKFEIRRLALRRIVDQIGRGGIAQVARNIGREANYVSRMLYPEGKRGKKNIGDELIDAIEAAYPGWLDGLPRNAGVPPLDKKTGLVTISKYETGGSMGNGIVLHDQPGVIESWEVTKQWLSSNVRGHTSPENLAIVTGFGDSMKPTYNPGDPLIVDTGVDSVEFDSVYFFRVGDEGFVKRLQRVPTADGIIYRAISDNPMYPPIDIDPSMDFHVLARVVQVWRRDDY